MTGDTARVHACSYSTKTFWCECILAANVLNEQPEFNFFGFDANILEQKISNIHYFSLVSIFRIHIIVRTFKCFITTCALPVLFKC